MKKPKIGYAHQYIAITVRYERNVINCSERKLIRTSHKLYYVYSYFDMKKYLRTPLSRIIIIFVPYTETNQQLIMDHFRILVVSSATV